MNWIAMVLVALGLVDKDERKRYYITTLDRGKKINPINDSKEEKAKLFHRSKDKNKKSFVM